MDEDNDSFELIEMDIEEFKSSISKAEDSGGDTEEDGGYNPNPISYQKAISFAKDILDDFVNEKESVGVVIFEYKSDYQIDVLTPSCEYEIFQGLYSSEDVKAYVSWNSSLTENKEVLEIK